MDKGVICLALIAFKAIMTFYRTRTICHKTCKQCIILGVSASFEQGTKQCSKAQKSQVKQFFENHLSQTDFIVTSDCCEQCIYSDIVTNVTIVVSVTSVTIVTYCSQCDQCDCCDQGYYVEVDQCDNCDQCDYSDTM